MVKKRLGRRAGRMFLAVAVLAAAATATAIAANQVLGEDETLYACAQQPTGLLRLVDDASQCRPTERAVEWNVQGPPGPPGEKGEQGATGDPGPGLESLEDLAGLPCAIGSQTGVTKWAITYPQPAVESGGGYDLRSVSCITPDRFEPNNARGAAADITALTGSAGYSIIEGLTIYPSADHDWFVIHSKAITFLPRARVGIALEIYRDGELIVTLTDPNQQFNNDVPGPHEWEFHFVPVKEGISSFGFALL